MSIKYSYNPITGVFTIPGNTLRWMFERLQQPKQKEKDKK